MRSGATLVLTLVFLSSGCASSPRPDVPAIERDEGFGTCPLAGVFRAASARVRGS